VNTFHPNDITSPKAIVIGRIHEDKRQNAARKCCKDLILPKNPGFARKSPCLSASKSTTDFSAKSRKRGVLRQNRKVATLPLGMATAFVEATLAQVFKVALPDGTFRGGPAFYIERGLGSRRWGMAFALLLIFTFGLAFNAVQANTIAAVLRDAHTVPTQLSGIVLAVLAAPVFFGGVRAVARVA
jgi:hypothetical protein